MQTIYLDYNATTPTDPAVVEELLPYLSDEFGNPSSGHSYGKKASEAVAVARAGTASLLGCDPGEVIFTGGGTESNNLSLIGTAFANRGRGRHIISTDIEHPAVLEPLQWLQEQGFSITLLPVDGSGRLDPDLVRRAITGETILISVMHANNEVGTIQPLAEIGALAHERGIIFHSDAAQSVGKIPVRVADLQVDLLTVAGHKVYAPKGIGALFIRRGIRIVPFIHGAGQEGGHRPGTENVPYIVGLGKAAELAAQRLPADGPRILSMRERLHSRLRELVGGVELNGHPTERLPNTLNVSFKGIVGADLLAQTPGIAASTGSACHEGSGELSGVLKAMGTPLEQGLGAVRFSIGRLTTVEEIDRAVEILAPKIEELRARRH